MNKPDFVTFAIDFDGTIIKGDQYPKADPKLTVPYAVQAIKALQHHPKVKTILWSCRDKDSDLEAYINMIDCCNVLGLKFDAINDNLEEYKSKGFKCKKVFANYYIDDSAMHYPQPEVNVSKNKTVRMWNFWKNLQIYIDDNGIDKFVDKMIANAFFKEY